MKKRKILLLILKIILISIPILMILLLIKPLDEEVDLSNVEFNSIDEFLELKYENMNFTYVEDNNFYFISITKRSIRKKAYFNEIIHFSSKDDYEVILDGLSFDINDFKNYIVVKSNNSDDDYNYAYLFIYEYDDNYLMYIKESSYTEIFNVSDNYEDFKYLKSIDYGVEYYFRVLESDKVTEDYLIEVELDNVGTAVIEGDRIIEAFKYIEEQDTN